MSECSPTEKTNYEAFFLRRREDANLHILSPRRHLRGRGVREGRLRAGEGGGGALAWRRSRTRRKEASAPAERRPHACREGGRCQWSLGPTLRKRRWRRRRKGRGAPVVREEHRGRGSGLTPPHCRCRMSSSTACMRDLPPRELLLPHLRATPPPPSPPSSH
jgi:hypothetical protein